MGIHWLWDFGVVAILVPVLLILVSPFMLSSRISRFEERQEQRQDIERRLKRVA